jgi:single-stranded-DNA-specific exonuclease
MERRWLLKAFDPSAVAELSGALRVSPLLARILHQRGISGPVEARSFLSGTLRSDLPSPFAMADMEKAAERLALALRRKEKVCVWGDYDVDGTTGAAALISFLREAGGDAVGYVPHRIHEGYGLNRAALEPLGRDGVSLLVTVDCGVSNHEAVAAASAAGMEVIIVDHHLPPAVLPPAFAVVNPHRPDCPFPDKGLSAAGLAFYLIVALRAKLREAGWFGRGAAPDIRRYLDIVTLGTIADLVPLRGANRVLARRGLLELAQSARPGIVALKRVAGIPPGEVNVGQVAFQLAPRINAAGRMDAALKVVEMLTTDSAEAAARIAEELDRNNRARQAAEAELLERALERVDALGASGRHSIVIAGEGWHPGVLGIVASRIVDRFYRPTVVIGVEGVTGKGSARSIRGFHLGEALRACADLLLQFGGHEHAGGLTIAAERLPEFASRFEEIARAKLSAEELVPPLDIDAELDFAAIGPGLMRELEALRPFGVGNPEPLLLSRDLEVSERREINGGVRLRLRQEGRTLEGVAFRLEKAIALEKGQRIDAVYRLGKNQWDGTWAPELSLVDLRPAG